MTLMTTVLACTHCSRPANYRVTDEPDTARCEACAIRYGYEAHGERYAAMKTLGFAISMLRGAGVVNSSGVSDDAIRGMVEEILTAPHSTGEYNIGGDQFLPGPDRTEERPWMTGHVRLADEDE